MTTHVRGRELEQAAEAKEGGEGEGEIQTTCSVLIGCEMPGWATYLPQVRRRHVCGEEGSEREREGASGRGTRRGAGECAGVKSGVWRCGGGGEQVGE